jgi:hypothetical protein
MKAIRFLHQRFVQPSIYFGRSYKFSSSLVHEIPPNLHIADMKIFEDTPTINFQKKIFDYAELSLKKDLNLLNFLNPEAPHQELVALDPQVFNVAIRKDIVLDAIRYHRHQLRQPKKTKRLNEIRGSKKKPIPQKKTGRAQFGNRRNSIWRGGQKAHGPVLRDYSIKINKKVRALAVMISLASKLKEGNLHVFDRLTCEVRIRRPL